MYIQQNICIVLLRQESRDYKDWESENMNGMIFCFVAVTWFGGMTGGREYGISLHPISRHLDSVTRSMPLVQTKQNEPTSSAGGTPIGGDEQNWGAMIVFAVGIGIFIIAYFIFRNTPATKKKKKKHF